MLQTLALPRELTIYTVGELRPQWLAWLTAVFEAHAADGVPDGACRIDAAAVDDVDAAGVQLLVALSHGLARAGLACQLTDPSGPLAGACAALGLPQLLTSVEPNGALA